MNAGSKFAVGVLSLLLLNGTLTGCTSVAKRAYYEVRGAKVSVLPAQQMVSRTQIVNTFAPYKSFTVLPASSSVGEHMCPQRVLSAFDAAVNEIRQDKDYMDKFAAHYPGGDPAFTVSITLHFVESKGLLGSALLFARVQMTDGATTLLDAVILTESKSFREGGSEKLAEETAKGIGRFLIHAKTGEKDLDEMLP